MEDVGAGFPAAPAHHAQGSHDTWYGNRDAFWLIDGEIYPKPAGKGSFALVTPSAQSVQAGRRDSTVGTREMTDIKNRLVDMDKLNTAVQIVYPTLFLVYNTKDRRPGARALPRL